ncbi:hypothetical protein [Flavobacterium sp.]|uniref:hypothetical protein n=1 Tax=Flavobacterium sp. TaxID=239 RepID=UPI00403387E5
MKRITFLLLLLPALCLTSCNDDDTTPDMESPELAATWKLVNVSGSIAGVSYDFEPGTIKWTFNMDGTVNVINNNTNENAEEFFGSGTYDFHFEANEATPEMCTHSLFVENLELGCQDVTETQLIISQVWADGYQLTFVK